MRPQGTGPQQAGRRKAKGKRFLGWVAPEGDGERRVPTTTASKIRRGGAPRADHYSERDQAQVVREEGRAPCCLRMGVV